MIFPEFTFVPDTRIGYDVYTFHAFEIDWKLTVCRRESDSHSIIGHNKGQLGRWFSVLDPYSFDGCLIPEAAYQIIHIAFQQWNWGQRRGFRAAQNKMQEALGL